MKKIIISISEQKLYLLENDQEILQTKASTAANGTGNRANSYCTPLGRHIIRAKIGDTMPSRAVFVARRWTGEICDNKMFMAEPDRDWILTRILWLSGCEPGYNRLGDVDTMRRYIYIHGTPDEVDLSKPGSKGCIRLTNSEIIRLFEIVPAYTAVEIVA